MKTIRAKIILLMLVMLLFMVSFWIINSYFNQKSIQSYNEILQRYLALNQSLTASQHSVKYLNNYMIDPSVSNYENFQDSKQLMIDAQKQVNRLKNEQNVTEVINYLALFQSQLDSMELAMRSIQVGHNELATVHFNESIQISEFIAEATLSLIRKEVATSEQVYISLIGQSINLANIGMWALIMIIMLVVLLSYWFSAGITRPIRILTKAARDISRGNFDEKIKVETRDEISFLASTFDQMRSNIKNLIQEIKKKAELEKSLQEYQLLLRESELKTLQAQMNPHFLFNTLNMLSKKAYLEGAEETSELISTVSGLLRYNLRQLDRKVTLREELEVIEQYFQILKARFPQRLEYQIQINANIDQIEMPSMILQPFVENAFIHAVEPNEEGGRISVQVQDQGEWVVVHIEDNGPGIEPQMMKRINDSCFKGKKLEWESIQESTGIGISNAASRLAIFYQRNDVFRIESVVGKGTCITLKLLKRRETLD